MIAAEPCHGAAAGLTLAPLPYLGATPERGNLGHCGRPGANPPAEIRGHILVIFSFRVLNRVTHPRAVATMR